MEVAAIMAMIVKGLGVVSTLVAAEQNAEPAIKVLINLAKGGQSGTVTPDELTATENTLDAMIADFNEPMG